MSKGDAMNNPCTGERLESADAEKGKEENDVRHLLY